MRVEVARLVLAIAAAILCPAGGLLPRAQSQTMIPPAFAEAAAPSSLAPEADHAEGVSAPNSPDEHDRPWAAQRSYGLLSRASVGADLSFLGIGIKGTVVLGPIIDGRLDTNFFLLQPNTWKIDNFVVNPDFHYVSMAAKLDVYPFNSMWRLSPGVMFLNQNRLSASGGIKAGSDFDLNGVTYYSTNPNPATGATPTTGTVNIGLHRYVPAFTLSGGFGRFVPHSQRRWSFPSEIGAIFTGAPTVDVNVGGWVCEDKAQTRCSNLADSANPVSIRFHQNLQTALARWRRDLDRVSIYPILSFSVTYSFNVR